MDQYKKDIAHNLIALIRLRDEIDPRQVDDHVFRAYFANTLATEFKNEYGITLKYGSHKNMIKEISSIL
jgi:hypothetical protein